mmetsp:Transcript_36572/g.114587  ORF Transcript_36572/g.114587 Transcript_36572/m.114587 type:complete len:227 (-) Transcript_36572:692-1372(-)
MPSRMLSCTRCSSRSRCRSRARSMFTCISSMRARKSRFCCQRRAGSTSRPVSARPEVAMTPVTSPSRPAATRPPTVVAPAPMAAVCVRLPCTASVIFFICWCWSTPRMTPSTLFCRRSMSSSRSVWNVEPVDTAPRMLSLCRGRRPMYSMTAALCARARFVTMSATYLMMLSMASAVSPVTARSKSRAKRSLSARFERFQMVTFSSRKSSTRRFMSRSARSIWSFS